MIRRTVLQGLSLARGVITKVKDGTKAQSVDVLGLHQEAFQDVEHVHPFGFFSVPQEGSEAILGFMNGNREHPVVLGVFDRRVRPKDHQPGDAGIHDSRGQIMHFGQGGIAVASAKGLTVTVGNVSFAITGAGVDISGGRVRHNGHSIGSDHKHTEVAPGGALSGPPQ